MTLRITAWYNENRQNKNEETKVINYEKHPERSYTQKRQNLKDLRNTILANLARDAMNPWIAFCLLQDTQFEVLDDYCDFTGFKGILKCIPQRKQEYQEMYDAVMLGLSRGLSKDTIDSAVAYLVLQNIASDLFYDCLNDCGENIDADQ